jgi:guanyl-specific ribonuclease Sa
MDNLSLIYENNLHSYVRPNVIDELLFKVKHNKESDVVFLIENVLNKSEIQYLTEQGVIQRGWKAAKKGLANVGMAATMATAGMGGNAQAQQPQQSYNAPIVQQAQNNELLQIINQLPFKYDYDGLQFGSQWNTLNAILPNSFKSASQRLEIAKDNSKGYIPDSRRKEVEQKLNNAQQNFDIINKALQAIKSAKDNNELNKAIQLLPENVQEDVMYKLSHTIKEYKNMIKHKEGLEGFNTQINQNYDKMLDRMR